MKLRLLLLGVAVAAVALVQPLSAATDTKPITVSASVAASAKLTLSIATVSFPDADPDLVPSISNSEGAVTVTAKGKTTTGSNVTLTLQAAGDLASGSDTIPISNVTWTATRRRLRGGHDEQRLGGVRGILAQLRQSHRAAELLPGQFLGLRGRRVLGRGDLHPDRSVASAGHGPGWRRPAAQAPDSASGPLISP